MGKNGPEHHTLCVHMCDCVCVSVWEIGWRMFKGISCLSLMFILTQVLSCKAILMCHILSYHNNVLLVKIALGRFLVNPIYHPQMIPWSPWIPLGWSSSAQRDQFTNLPNSRCIRQRGQQGRMPEIDHDENLGADFEWRDILWVKWAHILYTKNVYIYIYTYQTSVNVYIYNHNIKCIYIYIHISNIIKCVCI